MPLTLDEILAGFAVLKPQDFDYSRPSSDGLERLREVTSELMALPQPERGVKAMFDVMERMPEADLGSPGPLVHTLEKMVGHYEQELVESLKRKPTLLTVWMVKRILNGAKTSEERRLCCDLLRLAAEHPAATRTAREEAQRFIQCQNGRP